MAVHSMRKGQMYRPKGDPVLVCCVCVYLCVRMQLQNRLSLWARVSEWASTSADAMHTALEVGLVPCVVLSCVVSGVWCGRVSVPTARVLGCTDLTSSSDGWRVCVCVCVCLYVCVW